MEQHAGEEAGHEKEQRHPEDVRREEQDPDRRARGVVGHRPEAGNQPGNEREPGVEDHPEQESERANRIERVQSFSSCRHQCSLYEIRPA